MTKFLNKLSSNVVIYLSLIFTIGMVILNGIGLISFTNLFSFNSVYEIIGIILFLALMFLLTMYLPKIKDNKNFLIILFIVAFILRLIWIIWIPTEPTSDFKVMYDGATEIVNGNYNAILDSFYFNVWAYQLGFTGYLALLIKIFNGSLFMIKLVNVLITSCILIVIYFSAKKLCGEKPARIVSILYALYIGSIANTSVLTNQHLATLLFFIAIYLIISDVNRIYKWLLIGLLIGFGDIIRPEGSIILIALLLFGVFKNITNLKEVAKSILEFVGILVIVVMISKIVSFGFVNSGISNYPLENRDPLWKFTCGLNPETKGTYSDADLVYLHNAEVSGKSRNEAHMELIKERLSNPPQLITTMAYKYVTMWAVNDTSLQFAFTDNVDKPEVYDFTLKLEKIQYILIIVLFMIGIINIIKRKEGFTNNHIYLIILLGYLLAHLLIEIQPRYRYFGLPIFFIIAAYCFSKPSRELRFSRYN